MWFPAALFSCLTFGFGSYLYSGSTGDIWQNSMWVGFTQGTMVLIFWAFWRKPIFPEGTSRETKLLTLACGVCLAVAQGSSLMAYHIAMENGLNAGLVNIFSASTSLFGLTASYFVYNDDILPFHTLGCILNISGLMLIGASQGTNSDPLFIMFAIIPLFTLGFKQVLVKKICQEISLVSFNIVCFLTMFLCSILICLLWQGGVIEFKPILRVNIIYEVCGSVLGLVAMVALYYSITYGIVGVACAVSNSAIIIPTTLSWALDDKSLVTQEFVGLAIGIVGIMVISSGKELTAVWQKSVYGYSNIDPSEGLCGSAEQNLEAKLSGAGVSVQAHHTVVPIYNEDCD